MITVIAKATIKPGTLLEVKEVLSELVEKSRKEPGVISYHVFQDLQDENILHTVDVYESEAAFEQHKNTPHFQKAVDQMDKFLAKELENRPCKQLF